MIKSSELRVLIKQKKTHKILFDETIPEMIGENYNMELIRNMADRILDVIDKHNNDCYFPCDEKDWALIMLFICIGRKDKQNFTSKCAFSLYDSRPKNNDVSTAYTGTPERAKLSLVEPEE